MNPRGANFPGDLKLVDSEAAERLTLVPTELVIPEISR